MNSKNTCVIRYRGDSKSPRFSVVSGLPFRNHSAWSHQSITQRSRPTWTSFVFDISYSYDSIVGLRNEQNGITTYVKGIEGKYY